MITTKTIKNYLNTQPEATSTFFYSLVSNDSDFSKSMQSSMLSLIKKYVHTQQLGFPYTDNWLNDVITYCSIEDVFILFKNQESQNKNKLFYKVFASPLLTLCYKIMGKLLNLDISSLSKDNYFLLTDTLLLVTLYKQVKFIQDEY